MIRIIIMFLISLFGGYNRNEPAMLAKKPEKMVLQINPNNIRIILTVIILISSMIIFLIICFMIGGTESSRVYNQPLAFYGGLMS